MSTLRHVLYDLIGETSTGAHSRSAQAMDEKDDFGPIRAESVQQSEVIRHQDEEVYLRYIFSVCVGFLTVGPSLQSAAGEPMRDKELMSAVLTCTAKKPDRFFIVCPILLAKIRQRVLYLGAKVLDSLLDELSKLLGVYAYSKSDRLQVLVVQVLQSTMDLWLTPQVSTSEVGDKIREMYEWLSGALRKKKFSSWMTRDAFSVFLDEYLERDPEQGMWSAAGDNGNVRGSDQQSSLPASLLMLLNSDEDIRVRFRMAALVGRLFSAPRHLKFGPMAMYRDLRQYFTKNLDKCVPFSMS